MRLRTALPLVAAAALVAPTAASADHHHLVLPGESLTSIAARDRVTIAALAAANHVATDARLIAGTTIEIPSRPPSRSAARPRHVATAHTPSAAAASTHPYVVQRGDTLSAIAARAGTSVRALAALNGLRAGGVLLAGATIRLPGSGGAKPAATHSAPPSRSYVVRRGDTLSAIATRAGTSVRALAALNGLRVDGVLLAGATIRLPGSGGATPAPIHTAPATHPYVVQRGDTLSAIAARAGTSVGALAALNHLTRPGLVLTGSVLRLPGAAPTASATSPPQRYVVAPGDTLSAIASRAGISVAALAAANGIRATGLILAGATITLPAGSRPLGPAGGANAPPYPTRERVSAAEIEQIAAANDVPASLAAAIGWQESGFNNDLVSNADARGVMQILPKTWSWIESSLDSGTPLAPASALDNVRAGVLLLRSLLTAAGGNVRLAVAGYIQGLDSVRRHGMFAVTRQYVTDVLSLRRMFGGP